MAATKTKRIEVHGAAGKVGSVKVSAIDYAELKDHRWHLAGATAGRVGYVARKETVKVRLSPVEVARQVTIYMHKEVARMKFHRPFDSKERIILKDSDPFNCTRDNVIVGDMLEVAMYRNKPITGRPAEFAAPKERACALSSCKKRFTPPRRNRNQKYHTAACARKAQSAKRLRKKNETKKQATVGSAS